MCFEGSSKEIHPPPPSLLAIQVLISGNLAPWASFPDSGEKQ